MANTKNKNELELLLESIKKSVNNKATLTDKDITKINDVLEINKIRKKITEKVEKISNFKYIETSKILEFLKEVEQKIKNDFEELELEENILAEENKKIREKNKKNAEKIENEIKNEETEKSEAV